jgi:hypothetical protein
MSCQHEPVQQNDLIDSEDIQQSHQVGNETPQDEDGVPQDKNEDSQNEDENSQNVGEIPQNEEELQAIFGTYAANLSRQGSNDPNHLIGKWIFKKFAYTADGNEISDLIDIYPLDFIDMPDNVKARLHYWTLSIPDLNRPWTARHVNQWRVEFLINGNLIQLGAYTITYALLNGSREDRLLSYMSSAYSFVIKDDELLFFITGVEDTNLIIFKKIKKQTS